MAMKETIKKILKEEISNGYSKFELLTLQWIYKEIDGKNISNMSYTNYIRIFKKIKSSFGLDNKELINIVNLYKDNYTTGGFQQRDDVIRTPLKKYNIGFVYDYNGYQTNEYEVWGSDEDDAFAFAEASEDTGEFTEGFVEGEIEFSEYRGDHFDSVFEELTETIKKELNLLKEERNKKLTDKFLITTFKMIDKWLNNSNNSIDDLTDNWRIYEEVILDVLRKMGINSQEDEEYIIASFVENFMSNGDWDFLSEIGIKEPRKKYFTITKTYGMNAVVTDQAGGESYLPSELMYAEMDYGLDWENVETHVQDTYDDEYDINED